MRIPTPPKYNDPAIRKNDQKRPKSLKNDWWNVPRWTAMSGSEQLEVCSCARVFTGSCDQLHWNPTTKKGWNRQTKIHTLHERVSHMHT